MLNRNTYEIDTRHLVTTNVPDDLSRQTVSYTHLLDVADLTVDGSFGTGGAVCVMCLLSGMNVCAAGR